MQIDPNLLSKTVKALTPKQEVVTETQVRGTVVISQGNKYVRLDGSESGILTPVVDALGDPNSHGFTHGDRVLVLLKDHQAIVTKNISDGLQTKTAIEAKEVADEAWDYAGEAQTAAREARAYAEDANNTLEQMETAAAAASTTLLNIYSDAAEASSAATAASNMAQGAQYNLSEIEKVVDAINWIATHGTYVISEDVSQVSGKFYFAVESAYLTTDITVNRTKAYYTLSNSIYTYVTSPRDADISTYYEVSFVNVSPAVNPHLQEYYEFSSVIWSETTDTSVDLEKLYFNRIGGGTFDDPYYYSLVTPNGLENPNEEGWYEFSNAVYALSSDESVDAKTLYFLRNGSGTSADPYTYDLLTEYVANPQILGLYELDDVNSSISNYVSTHVSLDASGLVIQTDNDNGSKVRISGTGVVLVNGDGNDIAKFESTITLGNENAAHVTLSPSEGLVFWSASDPVAYFNSETLMITQAEITSSLKIGKFMWKTQDENRISLVYVP